MIRLIPGLVLTMVLTACTPHHIHVRTTEALEALRLSPSVRDHSPSRMRIDRNTPVGIVALGMTEDATDNESLIQAYLGFRSVFPHTELLGTAADLGAATRLATAGVIAAVDFGGPPPRYAARPLRVVVSEVTSGAMIKNANLTMTGSWRTSEATELRTAFARYAESITTGVIHNR